MIKEMVKGEKEKMLERNLYIHDSRLGDFLYLEWFNLHLNPFFKEILNLNMKC